MPGRLAAVSNLTRRKTPANDSRTHPDPCCNAAPGVYPPAPTIFLRI